LVVIHEPVLEISYGQKQCAQTDRHTPMTTGPCGLRRAGNNNGNNAISLCKVHNFHLTTHKVTICLRVSRILFCFRVFFWKKPCSWISPLASLSLEIYNKICKNVASQRITSMLIGQHHCGLVRVCTPRLI